jgi:anaerobic selenocysteine-containing dehydrogenase
LEPIMTVLEGASVCTLDCPDTCSLTVEVEGDRIVKVRGSDALPYTGGIICNKVGRYSTEFAHGANRLHWPLRRTGPRLGPVRAGLAGMKRSTRSIDA